MDELVWSLQGLLDGIRDEGAATAFRSHKAALTAAIEALEPPQDTAELRAEVERMAEEAFPDCLVSTCEHTETLHEAEVSYAQQADGEWHGYNVAAEAPDKRTALLMLRGALRARLPSLPALAPAQRRRVR